MTSVYQMVSFRAIDPPGATVQAQLNAAVPQISSDGGWQFQTRARRSGMTEYQGVQPYTLTIDCVFDGYDNETSVEPQLETLRRMMRDRVGPREEPAVVQVGGASIPLSNLQWVIQNIQPANEIKRWDGQRIRAEITVTLFQYLAPDILISTQQAPAEAAQVRNPTVPTVAGGTAPLAAQRTYTVRSGDTLSAIAARMLGNAGRWGDIASLNGIRDPRTLQVGAVLRIPS